MNLWLLAILAIISPITPKMLRATGHWNALEGMLLLCPPGFIYLDMRAGCFRVVRPPTPANFQTAAWLCGAYPEGRLARLNPMDRDLLLGVVERAAGLGLAEGAVQRAWIGIRRWANDQHFVYVGSNATVAEITSRPSINRPEGECVYWDLARRQFVQNTCDDDRSVDGLVCQADFQIYFFCNKTFVEQSSCCSGKPDQPRPDAGGGIRQTTCARTVLERPFMTENQPCAINATCVLHPPVTKPFTLFPYLNDGQCRIYCTSEDGLAPKPIPCDSVAIQTEESCDCLTNSSKKATCNLEANDQATAQTKICAIAVSCLSCLVLLATAGFVGWRKYVSNCGKSERLLDALALE